MTVGSVIGILIYLAVIVALIAAIWRVFQKANQPGWGALIPIYNTYLLLKIVGRPAWWLLLTFIPFVNFVILIIVMLDLAKSFGRGSGFGVGLILLGIVFIPILGFGDSRYLGPAAGGSTGRAVVA